MTLETTLQVLYRDRPDLRGVTDQRVLAEVLAKNGDVASAALVRNAAADAFQAAFRDWFASTAATPATLGDASRIKGDKNPNTGASTQFSSFLHRLAAWIPGNSDHPDLGEVRLHPNAPPLAVPYKLAQRINARLAHLHKPSTDAAALQRELKDANCYGAILAVLYGKDPNAYLSFSPTEVRAAGRGTFLDEEALAAELRGRQAPVVLMFGQHAHHAALFLGFDANGVGVVFQKGNLSENYPWEILTLHDIFDRYVDGQYNDNIVSFGRPRHAH